MSIHRSPNSSPSVALIPHRTTLSRKFSSPLAARIPLFFFLPPQSKKGEMVCESPCILAAAWSNNGFFFYTVRPKHGSRRLLFSLTIEIKAWDCFPSNWWKNFGCGNWKQGGKASRASGRNLFCFASLWNHLWTIIVGRMKFHFKANKSVIKKERVGTFLCIWILYLSTRVLRVFLEYLNTENFLFPTEFYVLNWVIFV